MSIDLSVSKMKWTVDMVMISAFKTIPEAANLNTLQIQMLRKSSYTVSRSWKLPLTVSPVAMMILANTENRENFKCTLFSEEKHWTRNYA